MLPVVFVTDVEVRRTHEGKIQAVSVKKNKALPKKKNLWS
jgi:hypothetical protein